MLTGTSTSFFGKAIFVFGFLYRFIDYLYIITCQKKANNLIIK